MGKKRNLRIFITLSILILFLVSAFSGPVQAITNGSPDGDEHPYVCMVVVFDGTGYYVLSGALLSPKVVLTAGHGTFGMVEAWVWFDEDVEINSVDDLANGYHGEPFSNPDFAVLGNGVSNFLTHDVGVVVLDEPVYLSVYAELPEEGTIDDLKVKTQVDLVGYGARYLVVGGGPPSWVGVGSRYVAVAELLSTKSAVAHEFMVCTANPGRGKGGTTFGDSGGPALLGGTNTVLAVTSFGPSYTASGIGFYYRVDNIDVQDWIKGFM